MVTAPCPQECRPVLPTDLINSVSIADNGDSGLAVQTSHFSQAQPSGTWERSCRSSGPVALASSRGNQDVHHSGVTPLPPGRAGVEAEADGESGRRESCPVSVKTTMRKSSSRHGSSLMSPLQLWAQRDE